MNRKSVSLLALRTIAMLATLNASAWAMGKTNPDPNAPPPPFWTNLVPMVMLVGVFYFFLLRPQSKQRKEREAMLGNLKKGDKVVTQSGFIVTISSVGPKIVEVRLNDETRVTMMRSGITEILPESTGKEVVEASNGSQK